MNLPNPLAILGTIAKALTPAKTAMEASLNAGQLNDPKSLAQLDGLESFCDTFGPTDGLTAVDSFNDQGQRTGVTYLNPSTHQPVKSSTFDPATNGKTADLDYGANGAPVNSATYDPATGKKLTDSHYNNGVLSQTDTLDANGNVTEVDVFDPATGSKTSVAYDPTTGNKTSAVRYGSDGKTPQATATFNPDGSFDETVYDTETGEEIGAMHGSYTNPTTGETVNGDPFSNCDPASIARIKEQHTELVQMEADDQAAMQANKDAAKKQGPIDEFNKFKYTDARRIQQVSGTVASK